MLDYRVKTFLEVYRKASFTAAARELHISQPAVSQHIHQLEAHYGCLLFSTQTRMIRPTPAGDLLFTRLSIMEHDERRLEEELALLATDCASPDVRPLRLGCTRTIADYLAPRLLADHAAHYPNQSILMTCGNTRELLDSIREGALDFALVEGSFDHASFGYETLSTEPFIAVAAPGTLAAPATIHDLLHHPLILRETGSGTREILEANLAARGLAINDFSHRMELASINAIKALVQSGGGVSFMYRIAVEHELERGSLLDVTPADCPISHDFSLVWERGSQYANDYRKLCREWRERAPSVHDSGLR